MIDDAVMTEAGCRLHEAAPAARIILFGFSARGDGGRHSDLDFLVVVPEVENATEESVRLRRLHRWVPRPASGNHADVGMASDYRSSQLWMARSTERSDSRWEG